MQQLLAAFGEMGLFIALIVVIVSWIHYIKKKKNTPAKQILSGKNVPKRVNKALIVQRE